MGALLRRHRRGVSAVIAVLFFATALESFLLGIMVEAQNDYNSGHREEEWILSRRRLAGPGSSPPTCRARCGRCFPCRPVHVAIQPGRSTPLEYYPEAWRCKCGNKFFMP